MKLFVYPLVFTAILLMSGCFNDDDPAPIPPSAYLSMYHGSPDAPDLDIYAESRKISTAPFIYSETFPYSPFFTGDRLIRFTPLNASNTLLEIDQTLEEDKIYSLFLVNQAAELDGLVVEDVWDEPDGEKAQVRLAHLSPDTGGIEVLVNEEVLPFGEENTYLDITDFEKLDKGKIKVTVKSKASGETLLSVNEIELRGNRVYTLVLRGFAETSNGNNSLSIQLLTNYIKI